MPPNDPRTFVSARGKQQAIPTVPIEHVSQLHEKLVA